MRRRRSRLIISRLCIFIIVFILGFFGIQYITKTGVFRVPGVVYYDESLSNEELESLKSIFTDKVELMNDVKISAYESSTRPETKEGEYLYQIMVPVTDFYESKTDVTEIDGAEMIPIDDLTPDRKLLAINGEYFLDDFKSGANFRVIKFESDSFVDEIKPLVDEDFSRSFPTRENVFSFAQTGVTALARGMNAKLQEQGDAKFFSENLSDYLSDFDVTHTSNESSFSDLATAKNICSDKRFMDTLLDIGLDVVELTGNHNQDCGNDAALETIDMYEQNNIKRVGGGKNIEDAAVPLRLDKKNNQVTFLAYNLSTGGITQGEAPGANQYSEENAIVEIQNAKAQGDFVVIDIQYYECSGYASEAEDTTCDFADSAAGDQIGFFRHLIDLGADLVVGTSAHQPQTFELYEGKTIYYGLGNLFFDQSWWPGTTRSLILAHYFYNGRLLQTKLVPTVYDDNYQTKLMDKETAEWFIERLSSEHPE